MQTEGRADGIMCGFGSFDGVPSCANKRLLGDVLVPRNGGEKFDLV